METKSVTYSHGVSISNATSSYSLPQNFPLNYEIFAKPSVQKLLKEGDPQHGVSIDIDSSLKLRGDGCDVKTKVICNGNRDINLIKVQSKNSDRNKINTETNVRGNDLLNFKMTESNKLDEISDNNTKSVRVEENRVSGIIHKTPDFWLRVYPQPLLAGESVFSVIFRCISCQLGLASILMLWTLLWVFIIQSFEGPYEIKVSLDFETEQNQLVIDLATELRLITPISPKWRQAIERRIEDERQLTMMAVARGARVHPGHFWDLCGTFLFSIYVMTALGFGAPVPQTLWGRTSSLLYAVVAVPTHIYLMVNMSTCVIAHLDANLKSLKKKLYRKRLLIKEKTAIFTKNESANCSRNTEFLKSQKSSIRKKITRCLCIFFAYRCVCLAAVLYYACGAVTFGYLRGKLPLEIAMFPLEFTTTGGLERVESYIRILYGLYVEGAMIMLSCALATLRRHSCTTIGYMTDRYRLFTDDQFDEK